MGLNDWFIRPYDPYLPPYRNADVAAKPAIFNTDAVRAVGFLEGFSTWLWTHVGPDLADEAVVEYDRNVAKIADYLGLPPREEQDASDGC